MPLVMLPLLFIVLLFMPAPTQKAPLSMDAFIQPYLSPQATVPIALGALGLAYAALYAVLLFPLYSKQKGGEPALFAMSQMPAIFGFVIGFISADPWASLPFFAVSLALYAYAFVRLR